MAEDEGWTVTSKSKKREPASQGTPVLKPAATAPAATAPRTHVGSTGSRAPPVSGASKGQQPQGPFGGRGGAPSVPTLRPVHILKREHKPTTTAVTKEDFPLLPRAPPKAGAGAGAPIRPFPAPAPPPITPLVEAPSEADPVPVLGVSKPKKTTSLALFDLVLTPKKRQSQREKKESAAASAAASASAAAAAAAAVAAAATAAGTLLSTAATGGGKAARPKRKKKLSGLKKKLLLERLEAHLRVQAAKAGAEGATESPHAPSSSVVIRHFVGDCDEEDEAQEMLGDARTILSAFGHVARVFLVSAHRYRECCMHTKHHGDGQEPADGETLVVGQFSPGPDGPSVAAQAARGLTGMLFGGVAIQAFVVDGRCEEELRVTEASAAAEGEAAGQESQHQQQPAGEGDMGESVATAVAVSVLYLDNVVSSDECEDEDEARESLTELVQLCGSAVQGPYRPVACWLQFRSADASDGQEEGERAVSACVSFSSAEEAEAVRAALHGRVLGGRAIAATVEAAGAPRTDVIASIAPPPPAPPADSLSASAAAAVAAVAAAAAAADAAAAAPVSKYTAAKAAPKQAKRALPEARVKTPGDGAEASAGKAAEDVQDATSQGGDGAADDALPGLPYSLLSLFTPVAPAAVEDTIKSLLKAVAAFQTAALQKDPAKARYNKRFVLGMKQTINAIRAGNARLVLLPPDVESSAAVDKMMQTLLLEAHRRDVPVVYCLSRRRLGKALGNDMRQSAAAIYNPDGAYEDFKQIRVWLDEERLILEAARRVLEVLEEEAVAEAADRALD